MKKSIRTLIALKSMLLCLSANATTSPEDIITKYEHETVPASRFVKSENAISLQIAKPNASGLSVNVIDQFNPDEKLNLLNVLAVNPHLVEKPADQILIYSPNQIELSSVVEIQGRYADVIIASPKKITCNDCRFDKSPRVTLLTADLESILTNGELENVTIQSGDIFITGDGLAARGTTFLDLLSSRVKIYGNVTTNVKGIESSNGDISVNTLGNIEIASGNLQVISGKYQYNYEGS